MADIIPWIIILMMLGFQCTVDVFKHKLKAFFIDHEEILWQPYVFIDDALPAGQHYFYNKTGIEMREPIIPIQE